MKQNHTSRWFLLFVPALLFLQYGCASKIPPSVSLPENAIPFIMARLEDFQSRQCTQSLDADVTLEWRMYGKTEKVPGMLQLQSPAFLRYSIVGPLGRQLFILVSNGSQFTLVNNSKARAMTGQVDSPFWRKYIPRFITPKEYINWLTGRISTESVTVREVRQDNELKGAVWLITGWRNSIRHHVLFYPESLRVGRHIVEGENKEVLLDVAYTDYDAKEMDCAKPGQLHIEGSEVSGILTVHFDEIYPEAPIPASIFHLTMPEHFTITPVE